MKKGICVAGNMLVDSMYSIKGFPEQGQLVHVMEGVEKSTGGAVCNVIEDLAKLDGELPLYAMGRVAKDADGDLILKQMRRYPNVDTSNIVIEDGITSMTMVMNNVLTGQRTFFTYLGASGHFTEEDISWDTLDCDILHIGYILLLDALDQTDPEYGSRMSRLLAMAQARGIKTSIDVVSEASNRFQQLVTPALKYTDYCIINEIEASQTTGIPLRDADDDLIRENIPAALKRMKELGVSTWAVIHSPEGGFGLDENNDYVEIDSLKLPKGFIKGSTGAGDAFCAGVLYGAETGECLTDSIVLGIASAAASLRDVSATGGMMNKDEVMKMYHEMR